MAVKRKLCLCREGSVCGFEAYSQTCVVSPVQTARPLDSRHWGYRLLKWSAGPSITSLYYLCMQEKGNKLFRGGSSSPVLDRRERLGQSIGQTYIVMCQWLQRKSNKWIPIAFSNRCRGYGNIIPRFHILFSWQSVFSLLRTGSFWANRKFDLMLTSLIQKTITKENKPIPSRFEYTSPTGFVVNAFAQTLGKETEIERDCGLYCKCGQW